VKTSLVKQLNRFSETTVEGEVILLNLDDGAFFSLSGTAATIWPMIDGTRDREDLLAELGEVYDAPVPVIARELDAFLAQLGAAGFVTLA